MSRVFVARERALGRTVVLKVLPPELAASLSVERFRREIQVAANLQHPHIVPLLSAGEAGEFLYYTMPLVQGESLRDRLTHQGELPIPTAARILGEVARALAYAHRHGIVHRDIKPDNILLTEDEAQVADFGIAKAITASAEQGGLTSVGVALGTPLYMAPEQAAADPTTDARADLYALGVVGYEMLAGHPPFQARTAAQLLAAHAAEPPVPLRDRRSSVSPELAGVIMRLLEKRPADRFQTADEVVRELERASASVHAAPTVPTLSRPPSVSSARSAPRRGRWLVAGGIATLGLALLIAWLVNRERPVKADRTVVAVAPFRVSAADSSLGYLREGMVDLLAAKLSGTSGIRPADPRTLLSAWRRAAGSNRELSERDAIGVAQRVGAGRLIQGDIVGTRQQVTINAAILEAPAGRVAARASVEGSPDSLPRLVDRLAGVLLALEAGEGEQRLASLTSTSLPALRAYLEGQSLIRRGEYKSAGAKFGQAIQQDSSFALAGLGLSRAGNWFGQPYEGPGSLLAWNHRDKLTPADRALLDVYLGTRWPAPRQYRDALGAAERLVQIAPDNAEAWQELGDELYHWGALAGISDAHQRAARAFDRALALDSTFAPALEHGTSLALTLGDTAGARKALARLSQVDQNSQWVATERWNLAMVLGDSTARREAIGSDSLLGPPMVGFAVSFGVPIQDADSVLKKNLARATTAREQNWPRLYTYLTYVISGRPSRIEPPSSSLLPGRIGFRYLDARFADSDSVSGDAAGAIVERAIGMPLPADADALMARYAGGQHALDRGRLDRAQRAVADLRGVRVPPDSAWLREIPAAFALLLETQLAAKRRSRELPKLLAQLDSSLVDASFLPVTIVGNLVAARLFEQQGNLPQALAAIRRRAWDIVSAPAYVTYHREEGRLAALNGDREGAIRAYRRYLALRSGAEPRLQPQVAQVRAELQALERESTDK
nr:serine/threonine protein kinase [uncultured bacterium]